MLGEPEFGADAAALAKLRGHWLLPAVGKPAAAAVLAELKVQRIADGEQRRSGCWAEGFGSFGQAQQQPSRSWCWTVGLLLGVCMHACTRRASNMSSCCEHTDAPLLRSVNVSTHAGGPDGVKGFATKLIEQHQLDDTFYIVDLANVVRLFKVGGTSGFYCWCGTRVQGGLRWWCGAG